jgi:glucosylceramidase
MYWNTSLKDGGISTWGWHQNSLVSVDTVQHTYKYNYEYYLMKHLSHFVKPGAKRLATKGANNNLLAFINTDKTIVVVIQNESNTAKTVQIQVAGKSFSPVLEADSYNTFLLK